MLLEAADKKGSRNVREGAVSYPRKSASVKVSSGRQVSIMSSGLCTLQHSKSCRCVCDWETASGQGLRERKLRPEDSQIPRIPTSDFFKNGNNVAVRKKAFNINEELGPTESRHEDVNMNMTYDDACSYPRICIDTTKENRQKVTVDNESLAGGPVDRCPVIRLSLRKPKDWKWKLTTSASSPAIIFPVIRLTDEHGDVLLDTGKKPESSKYIDSNGNAKEYPNGLSHRRRYERGERRNDEQEINEVASEGSVLGKCSEEKHVAIPLKNLSLDEGKRLTISERCTGEASGAKRSCYKNRRTRCFQASHHSVSELKSQSEGCIISSQRKEKSRNKVHRRGVERRRNRRHSSTSSDSSPEVRRRTRHRSRARGRTAAVKRFFVIVGVSVCTLCSSVCVLLCVTAGKARSCVCA
jgi:hypothetical protein